MTKKFSNRKERNKFLRISGEARKSAAMKQLKKKKELRDVFETIKRVNSHTAALKEKHPELFARLKSALENVEDEIEGAAELMGVDAEDVTVCAAHPDERFVTFGISDVREIQKQVTAEHDRASIAAFVGMDIADMGEWMPQTPEQVRESFIAGITVFGGLTREEAEQLLARNPAFIEEVANANLAIHNARTASINETADGTVLIGDYVSPFAGNGSANSILDDLAAIPTGTEEEVREAHGKWNYGKLHAPNVREVIKHTQAQK